MNFRSHPLRPFFIDFSSSISQRSGGAPSPTRASLSGNGSTNLTDRLADLEETVEDLRVHKEERLQSLRATREK